jgi:CheY-like chemotaxis protein
MNFQVLVCEGDADLRQWLSDCLSGWGMSVECAGSGLELLRLACGTPPDLILLDMVLPDVDSLALVKKLSMEVKTAEVPVVALAPLGWMADEISGVPVAGVIPKPITEETLKKAIGAVCPHLALLRPPSATVLAYDENGQLGTDLECCLRETSLQVTCATCEDEITAILAQPTLRAAVVMLRNGTTAARPVLERLIGRRPPIRVVAVADHLEPQEVCTLGAMRINEILVRPFSSPRLSHAVQSALEAEGESAVASGRRVLLVEDAVLAAKMIGALLEQAGYRVVHAANAERALRVLQRSRPEFMLLDVILPGMDGVEFVHQIQQSDLSIPFAVVTGAHDPQRMSALQSMGALRVFEKPIHSEELLSFMEDYFTHGKPAPEPRG